MKDLNQVLRDDYSDKMSSLKFSDKSKLYKLYEEPKHTPVLKKTVAINVAMACVILACGVTATAASASFKDWVDNKTADMDITEEKRDEIAERIEAHDSHIEDIAGTNYELNVNRYGETYGTYFYAAELISVVSIDKNGEIAGEGYCYWDDYTDSSISLGSTVQDTQNRNWIYVYDADGTTVLGKFVGGEYRTNEQLEDPDYDVTIIDGSDVDEYEALCQSRINEKLASE